MKNNVKLLSLFAVLASIGLTLTSCGGNSKSTEQPTTVDPTTSEKSDETTSKDNPTTSETTTEASVIKAVTAKEVAVETTISTPYYIPTNVTLEAVDGHTLTSKEKLMTYAVSDETVATINGKNVEPLKVGKVTVTATSKVDETKSCTFELTIKDEYFDRSLSLSSPDDDFSKELIADGGIWKSGSEASTTLYVRNAAATKWSMKTSITINSILSSENWPKYGIVSTEFENQNSVYCFFNAGPKTANKWKDVGVCEVANGSSWAWNAGVNNAMARHADGIYQNPDFIEVGTKFSIQVLRDGLKYYVFFNDTFAGSFDILESLIPAATPSYPGLFCFNSAVTYESYEYSVDETMINSKISALGTDLKPVVWAED